MSECVLLCTVPPIPTIINVLTVCRHKHTKNSFLYQNQYWASLLLLWSHTVDQQMPWSWALFLNNRSDWVYRSCQRKFMFLVSISQADLPSVVTAAKKVQWVCRTSWVLVCEKRWSPDLHAMHAEETMTVTVTHMQYVKTSKRERGRQTNVRG
jgi:hypothetical protein